MIYTLTLNPSLDYIMHVDDVCLGKTNRSNKEEIYPGGKGFNVSTILTHLEIDNLALGFIAGPIGDYIAALLKTPSKLIKLEEGSSRINVKLKGAKETEINGSGPYISKENIMQMIDLLKELNSEDYLVLAGSIPTCLPKNLYQIILEELKDRHIQTIVDTTGQALLDILCYRPFLIKPNLDELEELFHTKIQCEEDLKTYAHKLQQLGARNVLISLGAKGAYLVSEDKHYFYQKAAKGTLVNSVGSGDSMIAGFLCGYLKTHDYKESLLLGAACGGATAFSKDLASKEEILAVKKSLVENN